MRVMFEVFQSGPDYNVETLYVRNPVPDAAMRFAGLKGRRSQGLELVEACEVRDKLNAAYSRGKD